MTPNRIVLALGLLLPSVCLASPITWEFTGTNQITYLSGRFVPAVQSGDFTITATFDPDIAGMEHPECRTPQYQWALSDASLTWGGVSYATHPNTGSLTTNEQYVDLYCGTGAAIVFAADDPNGMSLWVGLMFQDPATMGTANAPHDLSGIVPFYAEFNWGPLPPFGAFAQAIGTFDAPTLVVPQTFGRFSAPSFAAPETTLVATPEPMSGLLLGTALGLLYLMQLMRRYR
jgi:hypothetical protein